MKTESLTRRVGAVAAAVVLSATMLTTAPAHANPTATSPDGTALALTPPMGWNNWAHFGCSTNVPNGGDIGPSEQLVLQQAQAMVDKGLVRAGYDTMTVDDCWMTHSRDAAGNLVVDSTRFPSGMASLATKLHGMGMKLGIYGDIGSSTCGGYPGSFGHFQQDANLFASWGVDYVKMDGCNMPSQFANRDGYIAQYAAFGQAMKNNASKRNMVYSISAPAYFSIGASDLSDWYDVIDASSKQGQLWRNGFDVKMANMGGSAWDKNSNGAGVMAQYAYNSKLARYSAPGSWNDPDFLITGVGLTDEESKSQIGLWAMMASPMILSVDVTKLSSSNVAALTNSGVLAVAKDSLGKQAGIVAQNGTTDVMSRPLAGGDIAVSILNRSTSTVTGSTSLAGLGLTGANCSATVTNLWTGATSTTTGPISASLAAHGTAMLRLKPSGCNAPRPTGQLTGLADKCLDVHGSSTTDGTPVELFRCTGNANQRWTVQANGTLTSLGKCLDAQLNSATGLYVTQLRSCNGASSQQWSYQRNGNVKNVGLGRCLDVTGSNSADATAVLADTCSSSRPNQANQLWALPVA